MKGATHMTSRPNILLITSDQQRADCFGFENRHIKTPHIDALAAIPAYEL
jgi:arylsulfatase A-like enzyme